MHKKDIKGDMKLFIDNYLVDYYSYTTLKSRNHKIAEWMKKIAIIETYHVYNINFIPNVVPEKSY